MCRRRTDHTSHAKVKSGASWKLIWVKITLNTDFPRRDSPTANECDSGGRGRHPLCLRSADSFEVVKMASPLQQTHRHGAMLSISGSISGSYPPVCSVNLEEVSLILLYSCNTSPRARSHTLANSLWIRRHLTALQLDSSENFSDRVQEILPALTIVTR
jgi:hypothetical protein